MLDHWMAILAFLAGGNVTVTLLNVLRRRLKQLTRLPQDYETAPVFADKPDSGELTDLCLS
jgi:hypothetical protein